jgi:hypothetical protein
VTEAMLDGKPVAPNSEELTSRAESLIPLLGSNANLADRLGGDRDDPAASTGQGPHLTSTPVEVLPST